MTLSVNAINSKFLGHNSYLENTSRARVVFCIHPPPSASCKVPLTQKARKLAQTFLVPHKPAAWIAELKLDRTGFIFGLPHEDRQIRFLLEEEKQRDSCPPAPVRNGALEECNTVNAIEKKIE